MLTEDGPVYPQSVLQWMEGTINTNISACGSLALSILHIVLSVDSCAVLSVFGSMHCQLNILLLLWFMFLC